MKDFTFLRLHAARLLNLLLQSIKSSMDKRTKGPMLKLMSSVQAVKAIAYVLNLSKGNKT